ncbi:MAG: Uma2 family endonuclease [Anaerolineae bacterium]|nr:Uma2 family endonuclease [Anaerolineae bacterium]
MSALSNPHWTADEYLAFERESQEKHEFVDGEIYLMTGASENRNLVVSNTLTSLNVQLRGRPCKVYPSDMLVEISATGDHHYPDVSVVCGEAMINRDKLDTLLNPTLIIEVLSPSTEQYDRGKKFQNYRSLESLREYVLIAQDAPRMEQFVRQEDGRWLLSDAVGLEAQVTLPSIGCTLALADVYDKVTFEGEPM